MEAGQILLEGEAADLRHNPEVKRAYLGHAGGEGPAASNRPFP